MEDILKRVPPQSIEAEESVIGAILLENDAINTVLEVAGADDFYRESHRLIFQAMIELNGAKHPIDAITLTDCLRAKGVLEQVGGPAYLTELAARVPTALNARHYARIVREKAALRQLVRCGTEMAAAAYDAPQGWSPDLLEEQVACAEYGLAQIANRLERQPEPTRAEMLDSVSWKLGHAVKRGVGTGFGRIDHSFAGFDVGHLTMLAARTSKGKTAFALNVALNAAAAGEPTAFFTLEQPADELWLRAIGNQAQVDTFAAGRRGLRDDEAQRIEDVKRHLKTLPLEILYRPSMRPRDLRLECRRLMRETGQLKLVVIDYLALMRGNHRERERWREMQEVVLALKEIAGELSLPLLVLQQLNRETNESIQPSLSNLRDTGATEEHASNVLFLWQEPIRDPTPIPYGAWENVNLIIGKQRNGPAGLSIPLTFKKSWGRFAD